MMKTKKLAGTALLCISLGWGCSSSQKKEYPDVIDTSMNERQGAVQTCFKSAQAQGKPGEPVDSGEVELSVNVAPNGKVNSVSVVRSTMNSKRLDDCVAEVVRTATFPKEEAGRVRQFTRVYKFGTQPVSN